MPQNLQFYEREFNNTLDDGPNSIYSWAMNSILICNIALSCLSLWLLIYKTPRIMQQYRWYLFLIGFSDFLLNVQLTLLTRPVYTISTEDNLYGVCMLGITRFIPIDHITECLAITAMLGLTSYWITMAMIFRYFSMRDKEHLFFNKKALLLQFVGSIIYVSPLLLKLYEHHVLADSQIQSDPFLFYALAKFTANSCAFVGNLRLDATMTIGYCMFTGAIVFVFTILNDRTLRRLREQISTDTYKYQRQLLKALILQCSIPVFFIILIILICDAYLMYAPIGLGIMTDQNFSRISFSLMALHTTANDLAMIYTIKPYRVAVFKPLSNLILRWKMRNVISDQNTQ